MRAIPILLFFQRTLWVGLWLVCINLTGYGQEVNELLGKLNQTYTDAERLTLYTQIGGEYQKQQAHKKATEYLEKAYQIAKINPYTRQTSLLLAGLAHSYAELKNYKYATQIYQKLLDIYARIQDETGQLQCLQSLAYLAKQNNQDNEAITYYQNVLAIQKKNTDTDITTTYNNLGYLYKRIGDNEKSLQYFQEAITANKNKRTVSDNDNAIALTNIGVCYANLNNFKQAKNYFTEALNIRNKQGNTSEIANIYNYLAANYYASGNNATALTTAQKALEYGNIAKDDDMLMTTYRILAEIYQKEGDFREYQRYNQLYQEVKNRLADKEAKNRQQILQNQIEIEQKENELKSLIADRDRSDAALKQSTLEKEKQVAEIARKQEELARLRSEQELQNKELANRALRHRETEQALLQAENEQKLKEQELLLKNKELEAVKTKDEQYRRDLKTKQEKEKRENELRLLEQSNKAKDQQNNFNQYIFWFTLLIFGLILFFVIGSLYISQRAQRKLAIKNREIEQQRQEILSSHEELQQNQDEILTQREFIGGQNLELTTANQRLKNNENILRKSIDKLRASEEKIKIQNNNLQERDKQIRSSIAAAKTIQTAILPYTSKIEQLLRNYFIIYRPKDIVSGDFYWLNELEGKTIFVVADCTGHGVPGAFMTLIGSSLLDKIVRVWDIHNPATILERLHEEIRIVLRQEETSNSNGMDLIVVQMQDTISGRDIIFSGAKNSLYYTHDGEVFILKGDRKSVGGDQNTKKRFTNQTVSLPMGSVMYLSSDGFIDQNDSNRKRFGEKRLVELLKNIKHLDMEEQKKQIENALDTHMQDTFQRDDILLIGVKI